MNQHEPEKIVMRLALAEPETYCDGEEVADQLAQALEVIEGQPMTERRDLLRAFAGRLAAFQFCRAHWRPVDVKLRELMKIGTRLQ